MLKDLQLSSYDSSLFENRTSSGSFTLSKPPNLSTQLRIGIHLQIVNPLSNFLESKCITNVEQIVMASFLHQDNGAPPSPLYFFHVPLLSIRYD